MVARVCWAIIASSLVGMTQTGMRLSGLVITSGVLCVRGGIQFYTQPTEAGAHHLSDSGRVLADAGGEHETIQATKRTGQRTDLPRDPIGEQFDGLLRLRFGAGQQRPHIAGDPPETPSRPECL